MLTTSVSTLGMSQRMLKTLHTLQLEQMRRNDEVAGGTHYDVAAELGARTGLDISLRTLYDQTDQRLDSCALLQGKVATMESALGSVLTAVQDVLGSASAGLGQAASTGESLQIAARGALDLVIGLLNTSSGNGYLFAGIEVDTVPLRQAAGDGSGLAAPLQIVRDTISAAVNGATGGPAVLPDTAAAAAAVVALLDKQFAVRDPAAALPPLLTEGFEGGFYAGAPAQQAGGAATPRPTARLDADTAVGFGVQANDPEVRDILQGLYMLAAIDTSSLSDHTDPLKNAYEPYLRSAVSHLSRGVAGLTDTVATLGIAQNRITDVIGLNTLKQKVLSDQINQLEAVDPAEAHVRLEQLETQLEAAAGATARIARMSLISYL